MALLYDAAIDDSAQAPGFAARMRPKLQFAGPGALGLGERYPTENPGQDGLDSERNRRVDLIFLDASEAEFLTDAAASEKFLYAQATSVERTWLPVGLACGPEEMFVRVRRKDGTPISSVLCRATAPSGEVVESPTNQSGIATFGGLTRGACDVRLDGLEAADLEAVVDGARELPPPPPLEEPDEDLDLFDIPPLTAAERSVFDLGEED